MSARYQRRRKRVAQLPAPPRPKAKKCKQTGKRGYATREDALVTLSQASRSKAVQRVYRCEFCSRWHLTSQQKRG